MTNEVKTQVFPERGKVGQTLTVKSIYSYNVKNLTNEKKTYVGYEDLYVEDGSHWKFPLSIVLQPGESKIVTNHMGVVHFKAKSVGKFKVTSKIKIDNISQDTNTNYITIT